MLANRLKKNLKKRKVWIKREGIEAYRLYEKDIPDYPFIIDIYKDYAVVYEKGAKDVDPTIKKEHHSDVLAAIVEVTGIAVDHVIFKKREKQKRDNQYEKIDHSRSKMVIREGEASFNVNLYDYLDSGVFLDHRPMRKRIYDESKGKSFLNLFCYTGTVSVCAALGGATTTSVDMSSTYQNWGRSNFELNKIDISDEDKHCFITSNVMEFLDHAKRIQLAFDLIFLDPPTFSNSKRMEQSFEIGKDHIDLVNNCMDLLSDGGVLYFSNNKRGFKIDQSLLDRYQIENITQKTIPLDFRDPKIHNCFKITAS